ncbi:MAG: hypothetical protein JSV27_05830 [Candidatus Bathyarchaeota archaeon]|nr:MAG: hypothetical protein JSV27_05830 [Candidatus Bathyarchaeota archaeon]
MTASYRPKGYRKKRSTTEKILFSAPEYIVFETRLGGWTAYQLQRALGWINEFSTQRIPKTRYNLQRKIIESLTDVLSGALDWMNSFIEAQETGRRSRRTERA